MDQGGRPGAGPFASKARKWRAVKGAPGVEKPPELSRAELLHALLREYPGYTLSTLLREDAHALLQMRALIDPDLGNAEDDDGR